MASDVSGSVVIIGAGQAGATLALTLRERGWTGPVHLIGSEDRLPYQRPPLSKGYVTGLESEADLYLSSPMRLLQDGIDHRAGCRVERLRTGDHAALLDDGTTLQYDIAVFATGAIPRRISVPGAELSGVHTLRTVADADALRAAIATARGVVIIGGGFLGLEIATAVPPGTPVTVVEGLERILQRAVSAPIAVRLTELHRARGTRILTSTGVSAFEGHGRVEHVVLSDGKRVPADLVLVAIGADADTDVAETSGLAVQGGILVDDHLRTAISSVLAIGDCARYPNAFLGAEARLESVQNATDQARYVAALIVDGDTGPYRALPWFWSHQVGVNLQIAGLATPDDDAIVGEDEGGALIIRRLRDGVLVAVETIDNPRAHVQARRALVAVED